MYTIFPMPKTQNVRGPFKNFLLKLYGEDVKRWGEVFWTAQARGAERGIKVTDTAVNEALLDLPGALNWLVKKDERQYFCGKLKVKPDSLVELKPEQIEKLYTHPPGSNPARIFMSSEELEAPKTEVHQKGGGKPLGSVSSIDKRSSKNLSRKNPSKKQEA